MQAIVLTLFKHFSLGTADALPELSVKVSEIIFPDIYCMNGTHSQQKHVLYSNCRIYTTMFFQSYVYICHSF